MLWTSSSRTFRVSAGNRQLPSSNWRCRKRKPGMRVLLDENMPRRLRRHLPADVEAMTVSERGWSGKQNGTLLRDAVAEFDAFLTTDQGIPHQQNLHLFPIGIIVLEAPSNRLVDLIPLMPKVNEALHSIQPGQLVRVTA